VLAHARALLHNTTPEGVTTYVDADFHNPELIISAARNVLNFTQPIAVMFMGVLGHVTEFDEVRSIVARVMAAAPSGSYLTLWDGTENDAAREATAKYAETGAVPYHLRSPRSSASVSRAWRWWIPAWCRSRSGGRTPSTSAQSRRLTPTVPWRANRERCAQVGCSGRVHRIRSKIASTSAAMSAADNRTPGLPSP
jgi:hypothetical protein